MPFALLCSLVCSLPDDAQRFGEGLAWYIQEKAAVQTLEGILDYQTPSGRIGIAPNYVPFRFVRKDETTGKVIQYSVHAPGLEAQLAYNVGQRVAIEGKLVSQGEGEQKHETLWVGKLTAQGPAPMNVFTELKVIARSNKFQAHAAPPSEDGVSKVVIRSSKELAKKLLGYREDAGLDIDRVANQQIAQAFGIKAVDWKSQMVIFIGVPLTNNRPNSRKLEITKLEVHERGVTVSWKQEEGRALGTPWVCEVVLVPRVEGEVTFKVEGKKPGDENKFVTPTEKKLIPQAPLK